jgi:hypothetical protein
LFGVEFPRVPKTLSILARQAIDFTVFPSGVPAFPNHVFLESRLTASSAGGKLQLYRQALPP